MERQSNDGRSNGDLKRPLNHAVMSNQFLLLAQICFLPIDRFKIEIKETIKQIILAHEK
jgi:hypothetical protein